MNSAYTLDYLCDDLIANKRSYDDNSLFAKHVIERLIENRNVDLLELAPYSNFMPIINKIETLIGFTSATFKTICANEDLFERFLRSFITIVKSTYVQETHYFRETAYAYFLNSYLENFLPITDQNLKFNSDWFVASSNALVNSPLKLLRPEVIEASFASEFTYVPTFRNLYPKLHAVYRNWVFENASIVLYPSVYQFIKNLIKFSTTLDTWPNTLQLVVLKHIMEHYYKFLIAETNDRDFMSFKMRLRKTPPFLDSIYNFLRRMLEDWPTDSSYITIVELWRLLICPVSLIQDNNKLRQFMLTSSDNYLDLIEVLIFRIVDADLLKSSITPFLDYLIDEMFSEPNIRLLEEFEVPMSDYLILLKEKIQVTYDEEKAKLALRSTVKLSWLERIVNYVKNIDSSASPHVLSHLENYLKEIKNCLNNLAISTDLNVSNNYNISLSTSHNNNSLLLSNPTTPDYAVDRRTKLFHLTPPGRSQVINRRAHFDFKQCSKDISRLYPAKKPWQNSALLKIFQNLSIKYNNSRFGRYLRYYRQDSFIAKILSKLFLRQAQPPKYVPMFSKTVSRNYYCLDFSFFANYFVIVIFVWFSLSFIISLINIVVY